jgi:hypothetical protein
MDGWEDFFKRIGYGKWDGWTALGDKNETRDGGMEEGKGKGKGMENGG